MAYKRLVVQDVDGKPAWCLDGSAVRHNETVEMRRGDMIVLGVLAFDFDGDGDAPAPPGTLLFRHQIEGKLHDVALRETDEFARSDARRAHVRKIGPQN